MHDTTGLMRLTRVRCVLAQWEAKRYQHIMWVCEGGWRFGLLAGCTVSFGDQGPQGALCGSDCTEAFPCLRQDCLLPVHTCLHGGFAHGSCW